MWYEANNPHICGMGWYFFFCIRQIWVVKFLLFSITCCWVFLMFFYFLFLQFSFFLNFDLFIKNEQYDNSTNNHLLTIPQRITTIIFIFWLKPTRKNIQLTYRSDLPNRLNYQPYTQRTYRVHESIILPHIK